MTDDKASLMADQAFQRLMIALRQGTLASGQFVSMPVLVGDLGFPIAAVREAVKRADARGLLEILPKRGVLVMQATADVTRDCLDMRAVLDCEGARRLIAAGPVPDLAPLRAAHVAVLEAARGGGIAGLPQRAKDTDLSLHDLLATGLDNRPLADAYAANRDRIAVIQNTRPFLADRIASAMAEHLAILDALQARDAAQACLAIRYHYEQTLRWWGVELLAA